jgi:prephenate dehydratase
MTIGYLGPKGSYSYLAAAYMAPNCNLVGFLGFPYVFEACAKGEVDGIVVPIENSLNGGIAQVMDLLLSHTELVAVGEYKLKIEHRLITKKGVPLSGISRIYSHVQALEQCARYLSKNFPNAKLIATPSTAAGLDMVQSDTDACIAGDFNSREGLEMRSGNIADESSNFTHFLYVVKGNVEEDRHTRRVYFSFNCPNVSGALVSILNLVCITGINMTKIESRPVKDKDEEYSFFVEVEGDYSTKEVKNMLNEVKKASAAFRLLGGY